LNVTAAIKIGVSACLLGEYVRYDGGHKHDRCITDTLGAYFTFVPVCPEVGCGLSTPREAMRLEGDPEAPSLITCHTRIDMTVRLLAFSSARCRDLEEQGICGFIFKERSPSCGLTAVPLFDSVTSDAFTVGLFAKEVARCFPLMPVVEAECLNDLQCIEEFAERVFLYSKYKKS
jgi:uncharacterized protein YbbK (DUF523 family)